MKITIASIFILCQVQILAQSQIGQWEAHVPMSTFTWIGETSSHVYAANQYGVLSYDREEKSTQALTKVNALSQTGITAFACNARKEVCVIGYSNGNMDIISNENNIINQPAIKNSQTIGDKSINSILFTDTIAWLSTGIGIVQMDISTYNILEFTPVSYKGENQHINNLVYSSDAIIIQTDDYILRTDPNKLFVAPQYEELSFPRSISNITQLYRLNEDIFALFRTDAFLQDTIFKLDQTSFQPIEFLAGEGIRFISYDSNTILASLATTISEFNSSYEPIRTLFTYGPTGLNPSQALYSIYTNKIIVADEEHGGVLVDFNNQFNGELFAKSSPRPSSSLITKLAVVNEDIYALPGGNEYTYNRPNIHHYSENNWSSKELVTTSFPNFVNGNGLIENDDKLYISSDRGGLAITDLNLNLETVYTDENSPLMDLHEDYNYFGLTGMGTDDDNNIYLTHTKDPFPLKVFLKNGKWVEIQFEEEELTAPKALDLLVLQNGYILQIIIDVGILVYDNNGTPANLSDDRHRLLTSSPTAGSLPSSQVSCFVQDNDGEVWIGTSEGIGVIFSPDNIFDSNFEIQKIVVKQDNYNGYLFATETVETIAVDGANRKWVGTNNSGLFLISADGQEQLIHFTVDNSPLFDNKISDLAILPSTGEVFIACENGLASFRSTATESAENLENIQVFPNPVPSGYSGPVAISNITTESTIRITDAAGNLIYETVSQGGQAIWNGNDLNGQRAKTGVYLIHIATVDGRQGKTSKLLFNR
jgi:hypothetical protein